MTSIGCEERSGARAYTAWIEATEAAMAQAIDSAGFPANLDEAVRYASLQGGKRTRPVLTHLSAEAAGGDPASPGVAPFAAAIELVHAFSLVHDDLPCIDNDLLRRGQPTTHAKFGEAMGLLAGDALLNLAYSCILRGGSSDEARVGALKLVTSGTDGMIAGQVLDTLGAGKDETGDDAAMVERIHMGKTAALITASCRLGGLAAGTPLGSETDASLGRYGAAVGLMFQVVDDLIDATQDASHAGKATGKDAEAGKLTYPGVFGVEGSRKVVAGLLADARHEAESFGSRGKGLMSYASVLASRTS